MWQLYCKTLNLKGKYSQSNHHFKRLQCEPIHSHGFGPNQSIQNGPGAWSLIDTLLYIMFESIKCDNKLILSGIIIPIIIIGKVTI